MIIVSGTLKVEPGALDKVRNEMEANIRATRDEEGCIYYSYGVDVLDPDTIIILEYWENWETLQAHGAQPHMAVWGKALSAAGMVSRNLRFIEAGEEKFPLGKKG